MTAEPQPAMNGADRSTPSQITPRKMAAVCTALWVFCGACATAPTPSKHTLADLLARHVVAIGGQEALDGTDTVVVEVEIEEPAFGKLLGVYRASRAGHARIDIYAGGTRVFVETIDGETLRQWTPEKGTFEGSPEGAAAMRRGVERPGRFVSFLDLPRETLKLHESISIAGVDYPTVEYTDSEGQSILYLFDPETFLVSRTRERSALHPDIDPTEEWFETVHSENTESGGVLRSNLSRKTALDDGEWVQTTRVLSRAVNIELDEALFQDPALVLAPPKATASRKR